MKIKRAALVLFFGCTQQPAPRPTDSAARIAVQPRPSFEAFPVDSIYHGHVAPVDLKSSPGAREFRTVLREGADGPPNFAGAYRVVEWGCGSPCHTFAIVTTATGQVYMPDIAALSGIAFRPRSRLLVVEPPEDVIELCQEGWMRPLCKDVYSYYYVWDGHRLALLDSIVVDSSAAQHP